MNNETKAAYETSQEIRDLRVEDNKFDWKGEPNHNISGRPHHLPKASWAGSEQSQFGPHRRGPTRRY